MAKTPEQVRQSYHTSIETKTGTTIPAWLERLRAQNMTRHSEIVAWLKAEHGLGHGSASLLAHDALNGGAAS